MKLGIISLGCAKNLVDTECFLGIAIKHGLIITTNMHEADILVVNTCGFIESAKTEALDTIMDLVNEKSKRKVIIIAIGCLVQRYYDDLVNQIPEVDYFVPIRDYNMLDDLFTKIVNNKTVLPKCDFTLNERVLSTPKGSAYLRIGEGCDNCCTYCAIPLIRGRYHSRKSEEIIDEAKYLASKGIKEVTLIAQDTTKYGIDLEDMSLAKLLSQIADLHLFTWIRVLYLYPDEITLELIEVIKTHDEIVNYFDIPLQHSADSILRNMNRRGRGRDYTSLIHNIRKEIPTAVIRTTLIIGFPGENIRQSDRLIEFIKLNRFEHLGAFIYSDEEGTVAYTLSNKFSKEKKKERYNKLMTVQNRISFEINSSYVGNTYKCICESVYEENETYTIYRMRSYAYAPDGVDGYIYVTSNNLEIGCFYDVIITRADSYDIYGKCVN